MSGPTPEMLLKRLIACSHALTTALRGSEQFEEWSTMKIFALRAFQRVPNYALGASELARSLGCSVPYASKLMKRMHEEGLIEEGTRYRNFRSMFLSERGLARLNRDSAHLEAFARQACNGISEEEVILLLVALGRLAANVRRDGVARPS